MDHLTSPLPLEHRLHLSFQARATFLSLPGRGGALSKEQLDFLDRLSTRLRIRQEGLDSRANTQDAEDDEDLVLDVLEGGRREQAEREVEDPVGDSGQRHAGSTGPERPDFGGVDPGNGG